MSFISQAQGAIDTAAHFATLEDRISKLEEKNSQLEERLVKTEALLSQHEKWIRAQQLEKERGISDLHHG
jgi:predicted  nucleic acid-binding Zn-ribbon protein